MSWSGVVPQNRSLALPDSAIPLQAPPQWYLHPTRLAAGGQRLCGVIGLTHRWGRGLKTGIDPKQHPSGYRARQSVMSPEVQRSAILTNHSAPRRTGRGSAGPKQHLPGGRPVRDLPAAEKQGREGTGWPKWWWQLLHFQWQWEFLKHTGQRPTLWGVGLHTEVSCPLGPEERRGLHLRTHPSPAQRHSGSWPISSVTA